MANASTVRNKSGDCETFLFTYAYDKKNPLLRLLKRRAEEQKNAYVDIFPWKKAMKKNVVMIVGATDLRCMRQSRKSLTADTKICGWLTAVEEGDHVYIVELSSRSITDPSFKGFARTLVVNLLKYCESRGHKFVYLFPLNNVVRNLYKSAYGFDDHPANSNKHFLYKPIQEAVPISPETVRQIIEEFDFKIKKSLKSGPLDAIVEYLSPSQVDWVEGVKQTDPAAFEQIVQELEAIACVCQGESMNANSIRGEMCTAIDRMQE